jgi:uncharacterized phage protein gp47/JayE
MYTPPTTAEIETEIISRIESAIGQTVPILPVAFARVLAAALSGPIALLYRVIAWAARQIVPQTADIEALTYLGDQYGLSRNPSVAAILSLSVAGDDGTEIPAGTIWTASGRTYSQTALAVIAGGTALASVKASDGGSAGNLANGATVSPSSPIAGVTSATVASTLTTGTDEETIDTFRARVIQRMRAQPQGGSAADYVRWALEVSGIAAAYAYRVGTDVVVYPLIALDGAGRIPGAPKLAEVQAYLQAPERRPLCATVYALGATERTVSVTITGLSPADAATKAAIVSAIESYLYSRYPRQYSDEPLATDTVAVAAIWSIIFAAGAVAAAVTMSVSGIGTAPTYVLAPGEIAAPGAVTWA